VTNIGRTATLVVAASNSTAASQATADYVCNGTNDATKIQDAIHAITDASSPTVTLGRVILTEGFYYLSQPIYLDQNDVTLEGQGQGTSLWPLASATSPIGGAGLIVGSNGAFDGITYLAGDSAQTSAPQGVIVRGLSFYDYDGVSPYPRTDSSCGTTSGGTTVTDSAAVTTPVSDLGMSITGPGIQPGTYITAVTAGTGYTISNPATATASSVSLIIGLAVPGSASGIINRGNGTHISDVNVQTPLWDGLSYQGFRQMGSTAGTLTTSGGVNTTATSWTVTYTATPPGTPFLAIVEPPSAYDYDPEIVCVTGVTLISGNSYTFTVQRGYLNTVAKSHAIDATLNVMTVSATSNGVTRDCYLYSPLRSGILTQSAVSNAGVEDSEWYACIIQGGPPGSQYTEHGIWTGGGGLRFIDCHPYYCSNNGLYAYSDTPNGSGGYHQNPPVDIIAGEYETNGNAGIEAVGCGGVTITGGVSFYANEGNDIVLTSTTDFRISDNWMTSTPSGPHISLSSGTNTGTIHDNYLNGNLGTVDLIEITGSGSNTDLEMIVHDNVIQAGGGSGASIALVNAAGVNVHDNTCETSIIESGSSNYNFIHDNFMASNTPSYAAVTLVGLYSTAPNNYQAVGGNATPTPPAVATAASPTGTTSTSLVMCGIGQTFIPTATGHVLVLSTGQCVLSASGANNQVVGRYALNGSTTVASGSNGGEISTIATWSHPSSGVLDVATNGTAGFPSSGQILVAASGSTTAVVDYTGLGTNSFTGCTYVSGSATGTVSTGGSITSVPANGNPVTGTIWGASSTPTIKGTGTTSDSVQFAFVDLLFLTAGYSYWFDLAQATTAGAETASLENVKIVLVELPN
jgi:hypothetical protein